jgi:hypothetical protein
VRRVQRGDEALAHAPLAGVAEDAAALVLRVGHRASLVPHQWGLRAADQTRDVAEGGLRPCRVEQREGLQVMGVLAAGGEDVVDLPLGGDLARGQLPRCAGQVGGRRPHAWAVCSQGGIGGAGFLCRVRPAGCGGGTGAVDGGAGFLRRVRPVGCSGSACGA